MHNPTPTDFGPTITSLLAAAPLNELGLGQQVSAVHKQLDEIESSLEMAFAPRKIVDQKMARACLAGLWLRFDYMDPSHNISQEIHNPTGSFWHGILHRREPDYDNAKYWFHRVPDHEVFPALCQAAHEIANAKAMSADRSAEFLTAQAEWDPFRFVDLVAAAARGKSAPLIQLCREIQRREWELLFDFCYRKATGLTNDK